MKSSMLSLIHYILQFFIFFGAPQGPHQGQEGSKLLISLKNNSQMQHICTCRYFFKRNSMVSHVMPPCISMYVNKQSFQSKNFIMPVHCCIRYHLCFEQNIYIILRLCGVDHLVLVYNWQYFPIFSVKQENTTS